MRGAGEPPPLKDRTLCPVSPGVLH